MTILIRCIFVDILRIETDSFNILKLNYDFFIERNFWKIYGKFNNYAGISITALLFHALSNNFKQKII